MRFPLLTFTTRKLNETRTKELFYVWATEGALITSDNLRTHAAAQEEMKRELWRQRKPVIVKVTTTETIVEEGE